MFFYNISSGKSNSVKIWYLGINLILEFWIQVHKLYSPNTLSIFIFSQQTKEPLSWWDEMECNRLAASVSVLAAASALQWLCRLHHCINRPYKQWQILVIACSSASCNHFIVHLTFFLLSHCTKRPHWNNEPNLLCQYCLEAIQQGNLGQLYYRLYQKTPHTI